MKSAHRIYEVVGFANRGAYSEAEVPQQMHGIWRFMERDIQALSKS